VHELLDKVDSDPQMKADAARGVIRGPQLALVELQMRKLLLTGERTKGPKQADNGLQGSQQVGEQNQDEGRNGKNPEGDMTRALAEAILSYYKQLGHMLSCAVDLRYVASCHTSGKAVERTKQNGTEQNRTEQNRTEPNRTEQNRTEQNRTEQKFQSQEWHDSFGRPMKASG